MRVRSGDRHLTKRASRARPAVVSGLAVDALDGPLARRLDVANRLPRWSGDTLDLVVDFITYVFVPAYAVAAGGLVPPLAAIPLAILIVVLCVNFLGDGLRDALDPQQQGAKA